MALALTDLLQIDSTTDFLWMTNTTGAYDVDTNPGGFGNSPDNPDLASSALVAVIQRMASSGAQMLEPVGVAWRYNPSANNDDQDVFQFKYINDGYHKQYLFRLPISLDNGITNIEGDSILEGNHFFMVDKVYVKTDTGIEEVTDFSELIDDTDLVVLMCEKLWQGKQKVKRVDDYLEYMQNRTGPAMDNPKFMESLEIREDIAGAEWAFIGGLTTLAQKVVEGNIDRYNL